MRKLREKTLLACLITYSVFSSYTYKTDLPTSRYRVYKLLETMPIDADWDKAPWLTADSLNISNYMGEIPDFKPIARAKMLYDDQAIYLIFKVQDRYVSSVIQAVNGPVSTDACVEFFFSPDGHFPRHYFNLEINAGGTPLMRYNGNGQKQPLTAEDFATMAIAHSLPQVVDPPIIKPVTWTIECRIPLSLLAKYSVIDKPGPGVRWRANFYKTASKSINAHWITWSIVHNQTPQFHLPEYFGEMEFM